ncbi:MAG TPA: preprotein translocase subunit SecG [Rudaea sp.]|nr:preprotein translocase subunit SecG [Rudaea sp.]
MLLNLFNVIYVLIAVAMIVLILLQRGAGAQAGSGFGSGASATVFGARGATTFLSRSTAVLAGLFFLLSLAMGVYLGHAGVSRPADDLGVMSGAEAPKPAPAGSAATAPAGNGDVPSAPAQAAPAAQPAGDKPAPTAPAPATKDDGGHKPDEQKNK